MFISLSNSKWPSDPDISIASEKTEIIYLSPVEQFRLRNRGWEKPGFNPKRLEEITFIKHYATRKGKIKFAICPLIDNENAFLKIFITFQYVNVLGSMYPDPLPLQSFDFGAGIDNPLPHFHLYKILDHGQNLDHTETLFHSRSSRSSQQPVSVTYFL